METEDAIRVRRAVRKYKDLPLDWDLLSRILDAGRYAPSAGNLQDFKFIIITDDEKRKEISEICHKQYWMASAPTHIIVCSEEQRTARYFGIRGERLYAIQSAAAAIENILICAASLGVGSCWVGAFDEDHLKDLFEIPKGVRVQAIVTLGYADEETPRPPKYNLEIFCLVDRWGMFKNRIGDFPKILGDYSVMMERTGKAAKKYLEKKIPKAVETAKEFGKEAKEAIRKKIRDKLENMDNP